MKTVIDCILFSFNQREFILPVVAYAEFGILHEYQVKVNDFCLGTLLWRGLTLPLIRPDLSKANTEEGHFKFAVLNALGAPSAISYFAILIDNQPVRQRMSSQDLIWKEGSKNIALYKKYLNDAKEIELIDLKSLSKAVEQVLS